MVKSIKEKLQRYIPWELFWLFITFTLIGLFTLLSGIFNFFNWSLTLRIVALVVGLIMIMLGIWRFKENYKKL